MILAVKIVIKTFFFSENPETWATENTLPFASLYRCKLKKGGKSGPRCGRSGICAFHKSDKKKFGERKLAVRFITRT